MFYSMEASVVKNPWRDIFVGFSVTQKEATTVMAIISFFVLLAILKDAFWGALGTSSFLIWYVYNCLLEYLLSF